MAHHPIQFQAVAVLILRKDWSTGVMEYWSMGKIRFRNLGKLDIPLLHVP